MKAKELELTNLFHPKNPSWNFVLFMVSKAPFMV